MSRIKVVSSTQRIIVDSNRAVSVINAGSPGPPGMQGPQGVQGPPGPATGGTRWYGNGPPGVIIGAQPGDEYLDLLSGDLYLLQ